jgi:plasmid maintenance system antidote protein VapI
MGRTAIHPGEFLIDELEEISIGATELSRQIDVPPNRIAQIIAKNVMLLRIQPCAWDIKRIDVI